MKEQEVIKKPDPLILYAVDLFFSIPNQKDTRGQNIFTSDSYIILCSSVLCETLYNLYCKLIQIDVPPIETLSPEAKTVYWEIAKRYYTDQHKAVVASKAAYILYLITNQ